MSNRRNYVTPRDETEEVVLDFCNQVRLKLDLKPRTTLSRGYSCTPFNCVVANTIKGGYKGPELIKVGTTAVTKQKGFSRLVLMNVPEIVTKFIRLFDHNDQSYKHLRL